MSEEHRDLQEELSENIKPLIMNNERCSRIIIMYLFNGPSSFLSEGSMDCDSQLQLAIRIMYHGSMESWSLYRRTSDGGLQ